MGRNIGGGGGVVGTSWLTAVKRAFRSSPNNDNKDAAHKKSSRRKFQHQQEDQDEDKKPERRRWLFMKTEPKESSPADFTAPKAAVSPAPPSAKAAVEIIQFKRRTAAAILKQHYAAKVIQTAFRRYLARRALLALKGIVKLQAIIRGQNVRKQAKTTMKCIQALFRVQARLRHQRALLSHDMTRNRSTFGEACSLSEFKHLKDIRHRKSRSRDGSFSSIPENWGDCQFEAILKARNEGGAATTPRASSTGYKRESTKTVEIDSLKRCSFSTIDGRRSRCQSPNHRQSTIPQWPKSPQVRGSMSPYRLREEEKGHSTANSPSLQIYGNTPRLNTSKKTESTVPNYMASTESAKARIRPQSMPRQRPPSTPDRERGGPTKKSLSGFRCKCNIMGQKLASPSFKSFPATQMGMAERPMMISACSTMDWRRHG